MNQLPWIDESVFHLPPFEGELPPVPDNPFAPLTADYSLTQRRSALYLLICAAVACGTLYLALLSVREVIGIVVDSRECFSTVQNANDLLAAGFTIVDPQGVEVSRFDD
jgi:hypothetical protein